MSPTEAPHLFRQDVLKSVSLLIDLYPLIESGLITLFPDPCYFDSHLQKQMFGMAEGRGRPLTRHLSLDKRHEWAIRQDSARTNMALPESHHRHELKRFSPSMDDQRVEDVIAHISKRKELDSLAVLQPEGALGPEGALNMLRLSPNYEMTLYLAHATGSFIVTDSRFRWAEILAEYAVQQEGSEEYLLDLKKFSTEVSLRFPLHTGRSMTWWYESRSRAFRDVIKDTYTYLTQVGAHGPRPSHERQLAISFQNRISALTVGLKKDISAAVDVKVTPLFPVGGLGHPNVSRMLVTSGVVHYLQRVPMAFFVERTDPDHYDRMSV